MPIITTRKGQEIIVDEVDYKLFKNMTWYINKAGYPASDSQIDNKKVRLLLHRVIMNTPRGKHTDHINGNKLDNRRSNLRICSPAENAWNVGLRSDNKTGYKGVFFSTKDKKYSSQIHKNGRRYWLGLFDTPEEAYEAYRKASKELHGEFSRV